VLTQAENQACIFPAAPALCLIAAKGWRDAASDPAGWWPATRLTVVGLAAALVVAGSFISVYLFELNLEPPESAIVLPIVLTLGALRCSLRFRRPVGESRPHRCRP
jgi:hypothetical protein